MIGRLQTNKVRDVVSNAYLIHSLDRWSLAQEIDRCGQRLGIEVPVLLQVNVSGEQSKTGVSVEEVFDFLAALQGLPALRVKGLMTIAVEDSNAEASRPVFKTLAQLQHRLQESKFDHVDLKYLSMGMSQDYEVAIEEGSNMVRIGSALFK